MRSRRTGCAATLLGVAALSLVVVRFGSDGLRLLEPESPSVSHGTTAAGRLDHGKRLPTAGPNFASYSWLGSLVGRNAVHGAVRDVLLDAWARLDHTHPEVVFVYGETGWPRGGPFPPHKTHQNGLSVDFMVPVTRRGAPSRLPTWPLNKWGYDLEFDGAGASGSLRIDFDAMAAHLHTLADAAEDHGVAIDLVIFDPKLQPRVFGAEGGASLRSRLRWSSRPSWVRHDEHYHVNFRPVRPPRSSPSRPHPR